MSRSALVVGLAASLAAAFATGCDGDDRRAQSEHATQHDRTAASPRGRDARSVRRPSGCPVTVNNTRIPPPGEHPLLDGMTRNVYFTNGRLWTILPPNGTVRESLRADGSIESKFPWWRGVRGRLTITGRRLDARTPTLPAIVLDWYGESGFQASAIVFPTEGCWRVTGTAGTARLSFVTLVVKPRPQ